MDAELVLNKLKRQPSCGIIVINDFYDSPMEMREFMLKQEYSITGMYPGNRTISFSTEQLRDRIQKYIPGVITDFPIPTESDSDKIYNGSFQYTTSKDRSWIHVDQCNNWAGVLYMTPDAPVSSGTCFYRYRDGTSCLQDSLLMNNNKQLNRYSHDMTKWVKTDTIGNVFNRLVLFNSKQYHMSGDYFGDTLENGRLFQVFFFSVE